MNIASPERTTLTRSVCQTRFARSAPLKATRDYTVDSASNRLLTTVVAGTTSTYVTDLARGNLVKMPHLPSLEWNHRDQLVAATRTVGPSTNPVTFAYDLRGQRAIRHAGTTQRIYHLGFELYTDGSLIRETLDIQDGNHRLALVETRVDVPDQQLPY
jgi:hypothetical protein